MIDGNVATSLVTITGVLFATASTSITLALWISKEFSKNRNLFYKELNTQRLSFETSLKEQRAAFEASLKEQRVAFEDKLDETEKKSEDQHIDNLARFADIHIVLASMGHGVPPTHWPKGAARSTKG